MRPTAFSQININAVPLNATGTKLYVSGQEVAYYTTLTGASGVLVQRILNTSGALSSQINAISGAQAALNSVNTTGNQGISGVKTFYTGIIAPYVVGNNGNLNIDFQSGYASVQGANSLDFALGILYNPLTEVPTLNWSNSLLLRNGSTAVDWQSGLLKDANVLPTLNWFSRSLTGNWSTNGLPIASGHLVNWGYLTGVSGVLRAAMGNTNVTNVVYTTGDQTVSGIKTFVNGIITDTVTSQSNSLYYIALANGTLQNDTSATVDWKNLNLANVGGTVLSWDSKSLTGNWNTNGLPTSSGHLVNWGYLTGVSGVLRSAINTLPNIVYTTGDQTVSGIKTFANGVTTDTVTSQSNSLYYITLSNGTLQNDTSATVDWKNLNLADVGGTVLSWGGKSLTGNWSTNGLPSASGNLVNWGYLTGVSGVLRSNVVYTTGTQTIQGLKTFLSPITTPGITGANLQAVIDVNSGLLQYNGSTTVDWRNGLLLDAGAITTVNWFSSTLTGEWLTNTTGLRSGSLVNYWRLSGVSGALQTQINNITVSNVVYTTGTQTVNGLKTFTAPITVAGITGANAQAIIDVNNAWMLYGGSTTVDWRNGLLADAGGTTTANWLISTLTGEWKSNVTGQKSGNLVNFYTVSGISGVLSTRLQTTGQTLLGLISAASAGVSSINGSSGVLTLQGQTGIAVSTVGQTISINATGVVFIEGPQTINGAKTFTSPTITDRLQASIISGRSYTGYSLDLESGLFRRSGAAAIDISGGTLKTFTGTTAVNYNSRLLVSNFTNTLDWQNCILYDASGASSLEWSNRILHSTDESDALNYNSRILLNSIETTTLDWENSTLTGIWKTNGTPTSNFHIVNWGYLTGVSGVLRDSINNVSVSNVVYTTGNQTISGTKTFTGTIAVNTINNIAGASRMNVDLGRLIYNGSLAVDWGATTLNDWNDQSAKLNWVARSLTGVWSMNGDPFATGHLVNVKYLNSTLTTTTGTLTGVFYPLTGNPSGFVRSTTGIVTVQGGATIRNGELLIGSSGDNAFLQGAIIPGSNITITSGSGSLTISATASAPANVVYQTGNQTISGSKVFVSNTQIPVVFYNASVDLTQGHLIDSSASDAMDWNNRILVAADGATTVLSWDGLSMNGDWKLNNTGQATGNLVNYAGLYSVAPTFYKTNVVNTKLTGLYFANRTIPTGYMFCCDEFEFVCTAAATASGNSGIFYAMFGHSGSQSGFANSGLVSGGFLGARHIFQVPQNGLTGSGSLGTSLTAKIVSGSSASVQDGFFIFKGNLIKYL